MVSSLSFSPDGRTLAVGTVSGDVELWDYAAGTRRASLRGHPEAIVALAFTAAGRALVTGGFDGTVRLWEISQP